MLNIVLGVHGCFRSLRIQIIAFRGSLEQTLGRYRFNMVVGKS